MNKKFTALSMLMFASWSGNLMAEVMQGPKITSAEFTISSKIQQQLRTKAQAAIDRVAAEKAKSKTTSQDSSKTQSLDVNLPFYEPSTAPSGISMNEFVSTSRNNGEIELTDRNSNSQKIETEADNLGKPTVNLTDAQLKLEAQAQSKADAKSWNDIDRSLNQIAQRPTEKINIDNADYQNFLQTISFQDLFANLGKKDLTNGFESRSQVATDIANKVLLNVLPMSVLTSPRYPKRAWNFITSQFSKKVEVAQTEADPVTRMQKVKNAFSWLQNQASSFARSLMRSKAQNETLNPQSENLNVVNEISSDTPSEQGDGNLINDQSTEITDSDISSVNSDQTSNDTQTPINQDVQKTPITEVGTYEINTHVPSAENINQHNSQNLTTRTNSTPMETWLNYNS